MPNIDVALLSSAPFLRMHFHDAFHISWVAFKPTKPGLSDELFYKELNHEMGNRDVNRNDIFVPDANRYDAIMNTLKRKNSSTASTPTTKRTRHDHGGFTLSDDDSHLVVFKEHNLNYHLKKCLLCNEVFDTLFALFKTYRFEYMYFGPDKVYTQIQAKGFGGYAIAKSWIHCFSAVANATWKHYYHPPPITNGYHYQPPPPPITNGIFETGESNISLKIRAAGEEAAQQPTQTTLSSHSQCQGSSPSPSRRTDANGTEQKPPAQQLAAQQQIETLRQQTGQLIKESFIVTNQSLDKEKDDLMKQTKQQQAEIMNLLKQRDEMKDQLTSEIERKNQQHDKAVERLMSENQGLQESKDFLVKQNKKEKDYMAKLIKQHDIKQASSKKEIASIRTTIADYERKVQQQDKEMASLLAKEQQVWEKEKEGLIEQTKQQQAVIMNLMTQRDEIKDKFTSETSSLHGTIADYERKVQQQDKQMESLMAKQQTWEKEKDDLVNLNQQQKDDMAKLIKQHDEVKRAPTKKLLPSAQPLPTTTSAKSSSSTRNVTTKRSKINPVSHPSNRRNPDILHHDGCFRMMGPMRLWSREQEQQK